LSLTIHEGMLRDFDRVSEALEAQGQRLRSQLANWLSEVPSIKVHSVTMRLKSRESLARKIARPDRTYLSVSDVTDIVGLRVITYFDDGVELVAKLLEANLAVDFIHSVDKRGRGFGYRSLHYVCTLPQPEKLPVVTRCEVQVRTMLEHAWAEIEHDLGYKSAALIPAVARRRLERLAGVLELVDQEFGAVRIELEQYAKDLPRRFESESAAIPLDRLSLKALLNCDEAVLIDCAIAKELDKKLGTETFFPDYLLKMLRAARIETVAAAREGLVRHHAQIVAMVRPYFAFASRTWSLSPSSMTELLRGYSLFFLAHRVVLEAPELGVSKVERLTKLYLELDYPDDAASAQHVASHLASAFREVSSAQSTKLA
jgi:putative GTP pyrophosphokinase